MRVAVLGGTGFLGRRTVDALRNFPGVEVTVASRHGPVVVDLAAPATFAALEGHDVVVDLTDGTRHRPDDLARWCVERGGTFLEATSDAFTIRRLADTFRDSTGPGRLILGGGLFTGMSNLMARACTDLLGPGAAVTFAVASSPYSGAGTGTISLMAEAAARPAVRTVGGERREEAAARGPVLTFGGKRRPTFRASLAEAEMLPASTGARDVDCLFAFKPAILVSVFAWMPSWLLGAGWFKAALTLNFTLLRRFLLRSVPTSVELVVFATKDGRSVTREVRCADGMSAVAWALAATAEAAGKASLRPGLSYVDDVVPLDGLLARVEAVAGPGVLVRTDGT